MRAHQSKATTAEACAERCLGSGPSAEVKSAAMTLVQDDTTEAMSGACWVSRERCNVCKKSTFSAYPDGESSQYLILSVWIDIFAILVPFVFFTRWNVEAIVVMVAMISEEVGVRRVVVRHGFDRHGWRIR